MKFIKSSEALVATFAAVFPARAGAETRQMFGYPCGFVNGNMFAGPFAEDLFVRVSEDEQKALLALPGAKPFEPMPGRFMRGYVCVPPVMHADRSALQRWLEKAVAYTASLPAMAKKTEAAAKAKTRPAQTKRPAKKPAKKPKPAATTKR